MLVNAAENNVYIIIIFLRNNLLIFNFSNSEIDNTQNRNILVVDTELDANEMV